MCYIICNEVLLFLFLMLLFLFVVLNFFVLVKQFVQLFYFFLFFEYFLIFLWFCCFCVVFFNRFCFFVCLEMFWFFVCYLSELLFVQNLCWGLKGLGYDRRMKWLVYLEYCCVVDYRRQRYLYVNWWQKYQLGCWVL